MAAHYRWLGWPGSVKAAGVGGLSWVLTFFDTAHSSPVAGSERVAAILYVLSWLTRCQISGMWVTLASALTCCLADCPSSHRTVFQTLTVHFSGTGKGLTESGGPSRTLWLLPATTGLCAGFCVSWLLPQLQGLSSGFELP